MQFVPWRSPLLWNGGSGGDQGGGGDDGAGDGAGEGRLQEEPEIAAQQATVPLHRFVEVVKQRNDLREYKRSTARVIEERDQARAQLDQASAGWAEERALLAAGISDQEGIDVARFLYSRLDEEGRPDFAEWIAAQASQPEEAHGALRSYLPSSGAGDQAQGQGGQGQGADQGQGKGGEGEGQGADQGQGKGGEEAAAEGRPEIPPLWHGSNRGRRGPRAAPTRSGGPSSTGDPISPDAIRAAREHGQATGDWTRYEEIRPHLGAGGTRNEGRGEGDRDRGRR